MTGKFTRYAAATAAACCVTLALTGCGSPVRDEAVALASVRDAVVVSNGAEREAADGQRLEKGDRVRTRAGGTATLVVRGRRVVLGGVTEVTVPDGATVDLARGAVLVDRRRGPGLTLHAGETTVDDIGSGAVRVERGFSVQVAALSAPVRVGVRAGSTVSIPRLYQAGVAGRAIATGPAPLQLRDDAWERSVIPKVVSDDVHLNALAESIDAPGATVVPASYVTPRGTRTSDVLLADAIARAARKEAARARELRSRGGSWGVVAALLDTSAGEVGTALSAVLSGTTAPEAPGASPTPGTGVVAGPSPEPGVGATPTPDPTQSSRPGQPKPTRPKPSSASPTSPSPSSSSIIDDIQDIIPSPLASLNPLDLLGG